MSNFPKSKFLILSTSPTTTLQTMPWFHDKDTSNCLMEFTEKWPHQIHYYFILLKMFHNVITIQYDGQCKGKFQFSYPNVSVQDDLLQWKQISDDNEKDFDFNCVDVCL